MIQNNVKKFKPILELSFAQQNIFDLLNIFLRNWLIKAASVTDFSSTRVKIGMFEKNIAAKLVLYQRFYELVVTTYTSWQCSEVLDNHRLLLVILIQSVLKKVHLSVTDAVPVRNWQRFLGMWKTTFAVQNTTSERFFINVIGCTINIGKQL